MIKVCSYVLTFHWSELHVFKLHRIKTLKIHYLVTEFISKVRSSIDHMHVKYITFVVKTFPYYNNCYSLGIIFTYNKKNRHVHYDIFETVFIFNVKKHGW